MATRSEIVVLCKDGIWRSVYCHNDGYISNNGKILYKNYKSQTKAERLMGLGSLSALEPKFTKPKGHTFETRVDGYCVAYHRDRGMSWADTKPMEGATLEEIFPEADSDREFVYVWDGSTWRVGFPKDGVEGLISLRAAIDNLKEGD